MGIIEVASLKPSQPSQIFSPGHPHLHSAWAVGTVPSPLFSHFPILFPPTQGWKIPGAAHTSSCFPKPALRTGPGQVFSRGGENRPFFPSNEQP